MLYAFFGTDIVGVRKEAHDFLYSYIEKGASVETFSPEQFDEGALRDAAGSTSLFAGEQVYLIDTPSGDNDMFEFVFSNLDLFAESGNTFVLIEEGLLAPEKKKLQKYAAECAEVTAGKVERFNVFSMAEALLRKDKKSLWLLLNDAKRNGMSEEEIIGTLAWQLKALRLAEKTESAAEAGQKPFVYTKAKRALTKFQKGEVDTLSRSLVSLYHDGHLGKRDLDIALERWVLSL